MSRDKIKAKTGSRCYYCGCTLPKRWHVDHLEPLKREPVGIRNERGRLVSTRYSDDNCIHPERDCFENKVPACPRCNIWKSDMSLEAFRAEIQAQVERLKYNSNQFRMALDYGLIEEADKDVEFFFEQYKQEVSRMNELDSRINELDYKISEIELEVSKLLNYGNVPAGNFEKAYNLLFEREKLKVALDELKELKNDITKNRR